MEAAKFVAKKLKLDRLFLVPAGLPPHKDLGVDTPEAEQRLELVRLGAEEIGAETLDLELRRKGRSYTVDTLRELRKEFPKDHLYLLMGTDMFLSFHCWREPEKMASLCTICAFCREAGDPMDQMERQKDYLRETLQAEVKLISLPEVIEISSTELRKRLACGEGGVCNYLSPRVYGCILRNGLYGVDADLRHLQLEDLRCAALSMLKSSRVPHVLGTEETAAALALRWGAEEEPARRAALLHDCTKKFSREQHLALCRQYGIQLDREELAAEKLLHAITGAAVARHIFGVPPEVENAIRWHTTGKADMTLLEKIIYLADYVEPSRDFCDLTELRRLAFEDLDRAMLLGLSMAVADLREKGAVVHSNSVYARDYLKGKLT